MNKAAKPSVTASAVCSSSQVSNLIYSDGKPASVIVITPATVPVEWDGRYLPFFSAPRH